MEFHREGRFDATITPHDRRSFGQACQDLAPLRSSLYDRLRALAQDDNKCRPRHRSDPDPQRVGAAEDGEVLHRQQSSRLLLRCGACCRGTSSNSGMGNLFPWNIWADYIKARSSNEKPIEVRLSTRDSQRSRTAAQPSSPSGEDAHPRQLGMRPMRRYPQHPHHWLSQALALR